MADRGLKVFALFDKKAKVYEHPFVFPHIGQAIRFVSDLISSNNNSVAKHPDDYTLYHLGAFDEENGLLSPLSVPAFVEEASTLVEAKGV